MLTKALTSKFVEVVDILLGINPDFRRCNCLSFAIAYLSIECIVVFGVDLDVIQSYIYYPFIDCMFDSNRYKSWCYSSYCYFFLFGIGIDVRLSYIIFLYLLLILFSI